MFISRSSGSSRPFRRWLVLFSLVMALGLALQPFGAARAADQQIEISASSGPTGEYITLTGTNVSTCGPDGSCLIVIVEGNFFLNIGAVALDVNNNFSWTGPLPKAGDFFVGTALKTQAVPKGSIKIGVGLPGESLATVNFTVTDNREGPFSSVTAWDQMGFRWLHSDSLVADGTVKRSWLWGPVAQYAFFEPYKESPDGWRAVTYYDKARMEVNDYQAESVSNPYYVSNGLLVNEMVTGNLQLGDNTFEKRNPANLVPPAGDLTQANRTPTFAVYGSLLNRNNNKDGAIVNQYLFRTGEVENDPSFNKYGVTAGHHVGDTGHFIASPFWTYLNTTGPLVELIGQQYLTVNGRLFDPLFSATGLPITEPYWTTTMVGGVNKDVLVQLFQRRVLTYTPSNSAGFQVEMGNVGLQYLDWRYGD